MSSISIYYTRPVDYENLSIKDPYYFSEIKLLTRTLKTKQFGLYSYFVSVADSPSSMMNTSEIKRRFSVTFWITNSVIRSQVAPSA